MNWTTSVCLTINPHKLAVVPFNKRRKLQGVFPLTFYGAKLVVVGELKYFELMLDSRQNDEILLWYTDSTEFSDLKHCSRTPNINRVKFEDCPAWESQG